MFPTVCGLSRYNISLIINEQFGHVLITRLRLMEIKGLMKGIPQHLPELEHPCHIFLLTKSTEVSRGPTIDVSNFSPGLMLQTIFSFFNVEIIR